MRVLVVEDEKKTASFVRKALQAEGFAVDVCHNGDDALAAARATPFDGIVLDIMLPGRDGLSVLRQLRERKNSTPVLLLSARGEVNERVEGLNAGADDYLPKPFELVELVARVRALTRRGGENKSTVLRVADLTLDTLTHQAQRGETKIELTAREYRLLEFLMRSAGRLCGRMMILEKVWDYDFDPGTNLVDVYIRRLREKIDADFEPKLLHTVRGAGYMLKENAMTIRTRLTLWYAGILTVSLLVIGYGTYQEIDEQLRHEHRREPAEHAIGETGEMVFQVGLPAVLLGLLGGWWLTRRALGAGEKTDRRRHQNPRAQPARPAAAHPQRRRTGPAHQGFQRHARAARRFVQAHPRIHPARLARTQDAAHRHVRRGGNRVARRIASRRRTRTRRQPVGRIAPARAHRGRPDAAGQGRRGTGRAEIGAAAFR